MKAIIQRKYGGVETLELVKVSTPEITDREILVKIHAANIASGDMRINTLQVPSILKPLMRIVFGLRGPKYKIRGITAAGKIEAVGANAGDFSKGDEVYFINSMKAGCLAEYIALDKKSIMAKKPQNISYAEAAPIAFGAMSAYHFINIENIKKGQQVLIYGASGSVGSYAVQLAKYFGADVTAVSSRKNHSVLLELGADHVIDYHQDDFRNGNKKYEIIFDAVGKISKKSCKNVMSTNGRYLSVKFPTKESVKRLNELNDIIQQGKLQTLVDKVYDFEQFKEAHEHTYNGHKAGNVVLQIKD